MFANRTEAGHRLAQLLANDASRYGVDETSLVVGLPRGGVPVALEVANELGARLDVILVRKVGVPSQPELAMGAIGEGGIRVKNHRILTAAGMSEQQFDEIAQKEQAELDRRARRYRAGRRRHPLRAQTVVIVDDGIATGSTVKAACQVARQEGASRVIVAVPVAPRDWTDRLGSDADDLVGLSTPAGFRSVGQFYRDFSQTTDEEVTAALEQASRRSPPSGRPTRANEQHR